MPGHLIYFYNNKRVKEQDFQTDIDGIFKHPLQLEIVNSNVQTTPLSWLTFALKLRDSFSSCSAKGSVFFWLWAIYALRAWITFVSASFLSWSVGPGSAFFWWQSRKRWVLLLHQKAQCHSQRCSYISWKS